jgi:transcriptional regulator with XRE-family HTH domain
VNKLAKLFGAAVIKRRKELGVSQENLAYHAGIDRSYMSRIERGIVRVTLEKTYQIAIALDCEPAALLPSTTIPRLFQ